MKEFFLILLLGKSVLLTPSPVSLQGTTTLVPDEAISAITPGACLEIDVSGTITKNDEEGINEFRDRIKALYPPSTIEAYLTGSDGEEFLVSYTGGATYNAESTRLSLCSDIGVPTDLEFVKVVISSKITIEKATVRWKNHKL